MLRGTIITVLFTCVIVCLAQDDPLLAAENQITPWTSSKTQKKLGCKSALPGYYGTAECLAGFISDQLQIKGTPNYALAATFRTGWNYSPPAVSGGEYPKATVQELSDRADVYDNAMAAIFLLNEGLVDPAKKICDTLVLIVDNERLSDGRLRSSYSVANPLDRQNFKSKWASYTPIAVDSSIDTGDQAFVVIALTRMYIHTGDYKYLKAAIKIGTFLQGQLSNSNWGGYGAGFSSDSSVKDAKIDWRAIVHNLAIYSAADNLFGLTNDKQWATMQANAEKFIDNMYDNSIGAYRYGTTGASSDQWKTKFASANSQTFKVLTGADGNDDRSNKALQWVINNLITYDSAFDDVTGQNYRFQGILHAESGSGIDAESTAAAALALAFQADKIQSGNPTLANTFRDTANNLLTSLLLMQKYAPNGDGQGIVATPNPSGALVWAGDEFNGDTYRYFPLLYTAATAWTGCAVEYIQLGDFYANPFSSYYKKSNKQFFGSSVFASASGIEVVPLDSSRPLNIVALIAAGLIGSLLVIGTVVLCVTNARLYKKNKQLEHNVSSGTPIKFAQLPTATPVSPGTPGSGLALDTQFARTMYASPATPSQEQSFLHE